MRWIGNNPIRFECQSYKWPEYFLLDEFFLSRFQAIERGILYFDHNILLWVTEARTLENKTQSSRLNVIISSSEPYSNNDNFSSSPFWLLTTSFHVDFLISFLCGSFGNYVSVFNLNNARRRKKYTCTVQCACTLRFILPAGSAVATFHFLVYQI